MPLAARKPMTSKAIVYSNLKLLGQDTTGVAYNALSLVGVDRSPVEAKILNLETTTTFYFECMALPTILARR
jgi:hypothetical protein